MIIYLNLLFIILYILSALVEKYFGVSIFINLVGIIYLLIITPYNLTLLFKKSFSSLIEKYLIYLTIYFFVLTPAYFFANLFFAFKISLLNIFGVNVLLFIFSTLVLWSKKRLSLSFPQWPKINLKKALQKKWVLFSALGAYFLLHAVNYYFYKFIPEWDSYAKLVQISNVLHSGIITQTYRGFFTISMSLISSFAHISPYALFAFWMIALQTVYLLVLNRFLKIYQLKNKLIQIIIFLSALSVPVINMEIDMVRPQNSIILFLPVYIYFFYQALATKKGIYWIFATLIALFGLNYHEFFVFIFGLHFIWIYLLFFKKYFYKTHSTEKKTIFFLISALGLSLFCNLALKVRFISFALNTAKNIASGISNISQWKFWFLGHYASDGADLQMGWLGISGALKYYSYYLSPALAIFLICFIFLLIKKKELSKDLLLKILLPFLGIFLLFAEILPRLNYLYLPERFWMLIDLILILSLIPLLSYGEKNYPRKINIILLFFSLLLFIGLGGSFYVAHGKKALTSSNEFEATQWIKKNTPPNSIFISQGANGPMIRYFAKRDLVTPDTDFFLSTNLVSYNPQTELSKLNASLNKKIQSSENLMRNYLAKKISFEKFISLISKHNQSMLTLKKNIFLKKNELNASIYILYSQNKFNSIYSQRQWWQKANFYNANLEKFNDNYPLVYNKNGIYIWKIK